MHKETGVLVALVRENHGLGRHSIMCVTSKLVPARVSFDHVEPMHPKKRVTSKKITVVDAGYVPAEYLPATVLEQLGMK
ncbi:MAG: hypothetical protein AB7G06_02360 [Bdellovibrionales bacterium]